MTRLVTGLSHWAQMLGQVLCMAEGRKPSFARQLLQLSVCQDVLLVGGFLQFILCPDITQVTVKKLYRTLGDEAAAEYEQHSWMGACDRTFDVVPEVARHLVPGDGLLAAQPRGELLCAPARAPAALTGRRSPTESQP